MDEKVPVAAGNLRILSCALGDITIGAVGFVRHLYGVAATPYQSLRRIVDAASGWELSFLALILILYFAAVSLVRVASFRPFLLTRHFLLLLGACGLTFIFVTTVIYLSARLFGGTGSMARLWRGWAYSLVPTLLWFLMTSVVSHFLPPPRTTSFWGILFSFVYLGVSATLFYWKFMLVYLAIRFALRLDLFRIALTLTAASPVIAGYSYGMYRAGIYRVPFL